MAANYTNQPTARMTLVAAPGALVNPIVADMAGESAANAQLMDISSTVLVDVVFDAMLTEAESVAFLNGFTISNSGAKDLTDRATVNGSSSDVTVDISGTTLKAALVNALDDIQAAASSCAGDNDSDSVHNLKSYFAELVRDVVNSQLKTSGLSKIINAGTVFDVDVSFNEVGAAADMETKLCNAGDVTAGGALFNAPTIRKSFLTQIPDAELQSYLRTIKKATSVKFLPMRGGQSITFVFETSVTDPGHLSLISSAGTTPGSVSWVNPNAIGALQPNTATGVLSDVIVRRVAVVVHMGQKDLPFQRVYAESDILGLSQEFVTGASHELYGLENELEFYSKEIAKLDYTLRAHAVNADGVGAFGGYTATVTAADAAATAAKAALVADLSLNALVFADASDALFHYAPMSSILAIRSDTEASVVEYNNAQAEFKYETELYTTGTWTPYLAAAALNPATAVPAPIDPQHQARRDAAKTALEAAIGNDQYLSEVNREMMATKMQGDLLINATYGVTAAPVGYASIDLLPATRTAVSAYNVAIQVLAIESALKKYYDESRAAYMAAPLKDREAFERPTLLSAGDLPMSYSPTIAPAVLGGSAHDFVQHN